MTSGSLDRGASPVAGLLAQIRAGTREAHDRVEAAPVLSCLLSPDLSVEAYVSALQVLHSFQAGAAGYISGFTKSLPLPCRPDLSRLSDIETDLAWFNALPGRELRLAPHLERPEQALGVIYVVEGSSLGGRVIGRAVSRSLGVTADAGGTFFCGQTAEFARDRWRAFSCSVDTLGNAMDSAGRQCVIDGAISAFAALETLLCRGAAVTQIKPQRSEHLAPAAAGQS